MTLEVWRPCEHHALHLVDLTWCGAWLIIAVGAIGMFAYWLGRWRGGGPPACT